MEKLKLLFPFNRNTSHASARKIESYTQFGFKEGTNELLDLSLGNCGCFMLGFDRRDIIEYVSTEMYANPFVSGEYMTTNQAVIELTEKIYTLSGGYRSVFSLSGSDAIESAVKLAKLYHAANGTPKEGIIGFQDSYHGSTFLSASIGKLSYMECGMPYSQCLTIHDSLPESEIIQIIENFAPQTACIVVETCSWSKGLHYRDWTNIRDVCRKSNVLFIIDDIAMCGGKTGSFFGYDPKLEPDIVCVGKALTGGYYPLSACLVSEQMNAVLQDAFLGHGFTYSFSLSGIYSTLKYIDVLENEGWLNGAETVMQKSKELLSVLKQDGVVKGFRNYGLMFDIDTDTISEQEFYDNGLNTGLWNNLDNNLKLVVPLNATAEYFNQLEFKLRNVFRRGA